MKFLIPRNFSAPPEHFRSLNLNFILIASEKKSVEMLWT